MSEVQRGTAPMRPSRSFKTKVSHMHNPLQHHHHLNGFVAFKKTKMCEYLPNCPNGNNCSFAHHPSEIQRGPNFKTSICRNWPGNCRAGDQCNFAHGEQDLRKHERFGGGRGIGRPQHFGGIGGRFGGAGRGGVPGGPRHGAPPGMNRRDQQRQQAMSRFRNRHRSNSRSRSRSPSQKENKHSGGRRQHSRSSERERPRSKVKGESRHNDGDDHASSRNGHSNRRGGGGGDAHSNGASSKRRRRSSIDSSRPASNGASSPSLSPKKPKKRRRVVVEHLSTKSSEQLDELILKATADREAAAAELKQTKENLETQKESMKEYDTTMQERLTKLKTSLATSVKHVQTLKEEARSIQSQLDDANDEVALKQRQLLRARSEHKDLIETVRTHLELAVEAIATRNTEVRDLTRNVKRILSGGVGSAAGEKVPVATVADTAAELSDREDFSRTYSASEDDEE